MGLLPTRVTASFGDFVLAVAGGEEGRPGGGLAAVLSASLSSIRAGVTDMC
jgi:hypothetical protein